MPERRPLAWYTEWVRHHVYLVPGFFGFANFGDFRYFAHVREHLEAWLASRTPPVAEAVVSVAPFFHETPLFLLVGLRAALGVLAALYRVRTHRLVRRRDELEAEVAERTQALRAEKRRTEEQAERLLEMDHLKSRFFTNVSHEFRTPLTLTIGPLEDLLQGDALPAPSREKVDLALRNSRRLLRLINQLLDVAKLEAGEMRLRAHRQDLVTFVQDVAQYFVSLAERRHIRFRVIAPDAAVPVYFDPDKLEQIVVNLLSNAFKFTPEGGAIHVTVAAEEAPAPGVVRIGVRDNGVGIPAEVLPHLFERFYQVDEAHASLQTGSGIGLSLARDLAALHGGTIAVESEPAFGSTFTVTLPLGRAHLSDDQIVPPAPHARKPFRPPPAADPHLKSRPPAPSSGDGQDFADPEAEVDAPGEAVPANAEPAAAAGDVDDRFTILVADDNADIRAYVRGHLAGRYRVLEAENGRQALDLVRQSLPDLVLSDVMMPELDGFGLVRALRADRETDFVPVILLTVPFGTIGCAEIERRSAATKNRCSFASR